MEKTSYGNLHTTCREELNHSSIISKEPTNDDLFNMDVEKVFKDSSIAEEDQPRLREEAQKYGSFEIPISNYLKNSPKITKIELQDFEPSFSTPEELFKMLDTDHLPSEAKSKIGRCCKEHFKSFSSFTFDIGRTKEEASIEITTDKQIIQKYYPISPAVHDEVEEILDNLCKQGIIRELETKEYSQFVNCLIVLRKPNKKLRIILDNIILNTHCKSMTGNFTTINEVLASLSQKAKVLSTVDLSQAYFNIPVEKSSQTAFTFYSPKRKIRYAFTRLVMGFRNSSWFLQQSLNNTLQSLQNVIILADDVICYDENVNDNIDIVIKVIQKLNEAGYKINPKKLKLARTSLEILGIQYHMGTLSLPLARVRSYIRTPAPRSHKQLKAFLSSVSFYRMLIKDYSNLAIPLLDLAKMTDGKTKQPQRFTWGEVHQAAFDNIKTAILNNAKCHPPNYSKPFFADADSSERAVGSILYQKDGEKILPIAIISRVLTKNELNWSIFRKEACSLIYLLRSTRIFTQFRPLNVRIDCRSVLFLASCKGSSHSITRMAIEITSHPELTLTNVSGDKNSISDGLTRLGGTDCDPAEIPPMSQREADALMNVLKLKNGTSFSTEEIMDMLNRSGLPSLINENKKKQKAQATKQINLQNLGPRKQMTRKIKKFFIEPNYCTKNNPHTTYSQFSRTVIHKNQHLNNIKNSKGSLKGNHEGKKNKGEWSQNSSLSTRYRQHLPYYNPNEHADDENYDRHIFYEDQQIPRHYVRDSQLNNYTSLRQLELKLKTYENGTVSISDFIELQDLDTDISNYTQKEKNRDGIWCIKRDDIFIALLPEQLGRSYIWNLHFNSGHLSTHQIKRKIFEHFVLLDADNIIKDTVKGCVYCTMGVIYRNPKHIFRENPIPRYPRQIWSLDLAGGFGTSSKGYKWIIFSVDNYSSFLVMKPSRGKTASEIQDFISSSIISPFGCPNQICLDDELSTELSRSFQEFLDNHAIIKSTSSTSTPHMLGIAERNVAKIKQTIRQLTFRTQKEWADLVGIANNAINSTPLTYGCSAEECIFGTKLNNAWAPLKVETLTTNPEAFFKEVEQITREARKTLKKHKDRKAKENIWYINKKTKERNFEENEIVTYQNVRLGANKALAIKNRPAVIISKSKSNAYIKDMVDNRYSKQHFNHINKYEHEQNTLLPENWDTDINDAMNPNGSRRSNRLLTRESLRI